MGQDTGRELHGVGTLRPGSYLEYLATSLGWPEAFPAPAHTGPFPYNPVSLHTLDFETSVTQHQHSLQHFTLSHVGQLPTNHT